MVMPKHSIGPVRIICNLEAAVTAVTETVPKVFTAVCRIIEPIAVMENCNAIGRPMETNRPQQESDNFHSSFRIRKISYFLNI